MANWIGKGGGSGGGGSPSNPSSSKNFVVADDAEAATLVGLKAGDTIRITASGSPAEVKLWQVLAPGTGTLATITKVELETLEARRDATTVVSVASEAARLALIDRYDPFRIVKQADTDEVWLQTANPASSAANWSLISGSPSSTLQDGGDTLIDLADTLIER